MGKRKQGRNRGDNDGMVYSTNPGYSWEDEDQDEEDWSVGQCATLYVSLDRKQRAGKPVTLVEGFDGPATELLLLGKALKQQCGWEVPLKKAASWCKAITATRWWPI